jgi:ribonuclease BN (tRNA processing enzyme)
MKLVLLGTTGYHPNDLRHTPCLVLPEQGVVLDAGTSLYRLRGHLRTEELDIFLTHAHLDHVIGLTFLLGVLHDTLVRRVRLHGEAEKLAVVREHLFHRLLFPVPLAAEFHPLAGPVELPGGGRLTWFPLVHPGGSVGYRLDWPGHSLAYVTDTTAEPGAAYIEHIRGVELLIHECYFGDAQAEFARRTGHSNATAVAEVARAAGVGRIVLVHLNPAIAEHDPIDVAVVRRIFPATELGVDGMELEF